MSITRERLLEIIVTGPEASGAEQNELARMALAAMDSESECLPLDYLQGHKDGLEWAAQLAEANHPETGDWLYDDPIELAKAIRKGPDMPPAQPVADSEPVAIIDQANLDYLRSGADADVWPPEREEMGDVLLYRHAQPAPVSYSDFEEFWSAYIHPLAQDDELKDFSWGIWNACVSNSQPAPVVPEEMPCGGAADDYHDGYQDGWNACRAAMLQAGTLNNEGTKQAWTGIPDIDNAINTLDRIDTLESCDDDRIEAVKTVLRGLAGNSPVITDSSADMLRRWLAFGRGMQNAGSQLPHNLIAETESMLAAAPQSPGIEPATVPGKWIPVSERMPEVGVKVLCFPAEDEPIHAVFNGQLWLQDISWSNSDEPIDNVITCNVTHWVPLPASPQEVK